MANTDVDGRPYSAPSREAPLARKSRKHYHTQTGHGRHGHSPQKGHMTPNNKTYAILEYLSMEIDNSSWNSTSPDKAYVTHGLGGNRFLTIHIAKNRMPKYSHGVHRANAEHIHVQLLLWGLDAGIADERGYRMQELEFTSLLTSAYSRLGEPDVPMKRAFAQYLLDVRARAN